MMIIDLNANSLKMPFQGKQLQYVLFNYFENKASLLQTANLWVLSLPLKFKVRLNLLCNVDRLITPHHLAFSSIVRKVKCLLRIECFYLSEHHIISHPKLMINLFETWKVLNEWKNLTGSLRTIPQSTQLVNPL